MQSKILKRYILESLVHFECEDMNYFERPYSSDVNALKCDVDDIASWCTMDSATTDKPLTIVLDLEAKERGVFSGRVKGVCLFEININRLKTYEGVQDIMDHMEYFAFDEPMGGFIEEVDSPVDEVSFGYAEGYKEKVLDFICQ